MAKKKQKKMKGGTSMRQRYEGSVRRIVGAQHEDSTVRLQGFPRKNTQIISSLDGGLVTVTNAREVRS